MVSKYAYERFDEAAAAPIEPIAPRKPEPAVTELGDLGKSRSGPASNDTDTIHLLQARAPHQRITRSRRGWRFAALSCAITVLIVFLINLIFTIHIAVSSGFDEDGLGILMEGDCGKARQTNVGIHLVINVLSTILLGCSNYCMQCASAPTRKEVDRAHAKGKWLDIGVPSLRNLEIITPRRKLLWAALVLSSVPLHLFFNSVVFASTSANDYVVAAGNQAFADGKIFNATALKQVGINTNALHVIQEISDRNPSKTLQRLEVADCIHAYGQDFVSDRSNLVLVLKGTTSNDAAQVYDYTTSEIVDPHTVSCDSDGFNWMCGISSCDATCSIDSLASEPDSFSPFGHGTVAYCLSQETEQHCKLQVSLHIIIVVMVFNFLKILLMLYTSFMIEESPLLTIGDAISSFLQAPDPSTEGCCLFTKHDFSPVLAQPRVYGTPRRMFTPEPKSFKKVNIRWAKAGSRARWIWCNLLTILALVICAILLVVGISAIQGPKDFPLLAALGLGAINVRTLISWSLPADGSQGIISNILVANSPQPILSFVYFTYNGIFTCMLASYEWSRFASERRSVRVSGVPWGFQRSSYFLQLPYRYALPIMGLSGLLHWLVSQSIFLVSVEPYDFDGNFGSSAYLTCGYSPIAILSVIIVGMFMLILGWGMGSRRYTAGMLLGGTCSLVISAACHVGEQGSDDARQAYDTAFMPIKWGVISEGNQDGSQVGHCGFSSQRVEFPEDGHVYAGYSFTKRKLE